VLWALLNAVKELYHHETAQFAFQKRDIALMKAEAEVKIAKLEAESTSKDQQIAHLKARAEKNEKENVVIKFYLCAKDSSAAFCH
jgi:phage baseplate assembly protein W